MIIIDGNELLDIRCVVRSAKLIYYRKFVGLLTNSVHNDKIKMSTLFVLSFFNLVQKCYFVDYLLSWV